MTEATVTYENLQKYYQNMFDSGLTVGALCGLEEALYEEDNNEDNQEDDNNNTEAGEE